MQLNGSYIQSTCTHIHLHTSLLTLSAHALKGLRYSFGLSVYLSACQHKICRLHCLYLGNKVASYHRVLYGVFQVFFVWLLFRSRVVASFAGHCRLPQSRPQTLLYARREMEGLEHNPRRKYPEGMLRARNHDV